ncbi:MAG: diaminopimelate decarboxylase [Phycisphaeraceae bacterium]|nr:diaminopimelate decarboxylase [Phycisphaeraceae bacterium]
MDHFEYRDGELHAGDVPLAAIAAEHGTPLYVYSAATFLDHFHRLNAAFAPLNPLICFSVKSCSNVHILRLLAERGAGMDVVSGGELLRARLAGVPAERTVFAGVGKTDDEIHQALAGEPDRADPGPIGLFNIESEPEYEVVAAAARAMGVSARAALRVNPGISAGGHAYVRTGHAETKFGVELPHAEALFEKFAREKHLRLCAIHLHIGSSITDPAPYAQAVSKALALIDRLERKGVRIEALDLGGGFGADYTSGAAPPAAVFAAAIVPLLESRARAGLRIILEPGRSIAANAGVLLTRVLFVKHTGPRKFVVCDAGMNTLLRPSLYNAFHFIWPVSVSPQHVPPSRRESLDLPGLEPCDVVGPVCETGDFLARDRTLPLLARGDLLAVFAAGAYGMSMASRYNSHPLPAEVLVEGALARLIRRRESPDDLVAHER